MAIKFEDILSARKIIEPYCHRTPILSSTSLNNLLGCELYFKCENFQKIGAFKFRGAINTIFNLKENDLTHGVATHSSGNHAQAISLAAKLKNIPAYIVMPENAPKIKIEAVKNYGGQIFFCENNLTAREDKLQEVINQTQAVFIHPFENPFVIAGQGTVGCEIYDELENLDFLITPVGGGGLLSGCAIASKNLSPHTKIIGAEPELANDAYLSFQQKKLIPAGPPKTIADGLLTSLGKPNFEIILDTVEEIITASERNIKLGLKFIFERLKCVIEPSAALPLAIILENPEKFKHKKIACVLTGGNIDLANLSSLLLGLD